MDVIPVTLDFKKRKTHEMIYGACWHIGNPASDVEAILTFIERAKQTFWWFAGDGVEGIGPADNRFQAEEHNQPILTTMTVCSNFVKEARHTCGGYVCGNHEYGGSKAMGSIASKIATDAGVRFLGACSVFEIECPSGKIHLMTGHGAGSMGFNSGFPERDDLNRRMKLRRILKQHPGKIKCVAHYHRTIVDPAKETMTGTIEGGNFARRSVPLHDSWVMACPSLFKNYDNGNKVNYAELKLLPPTDMGWLGIVMNRNATVGCVREYDNHGQIAAEYYKENVR